jgi:hypothetical protein
MNFCRIIALLEAPLLVVAVFLVVLRPIPLSDSVGFLLL